MSDRFPDRTVADVMRRLLLGFLALAAAVAVVFGVAGLAFGHAEEREHAVAGAVTRIEVNAGAGDVSLMEADVPAVTIHERRSYAWRRPRLAIDRSGSVLRVTVRCGAWCSDDLDIVVPRHVRSGSVRTTSGDISLAGLGGDFRAVSASGDVRATRSSGELALRSASGAVARR
jgi:hypothetical protein